MRRGTYFRNFLPEKWDFIPSEAPLSEVYAKLETSPSGLTAREALRRYAMYGPNDVHQAREKSLLKDIAERFRNPLVLLLLSIAVLSFFFGNKLGTVVILFMILTNVALSFFQEHRAEKAGEKLQEIVRTNCTVIRENFSLSKPLSMVVPGDIVSLRAGDIIPGDIRIIESNDLFVNQSALTGESFPVPKYPDDSASAEGETAKIRNMAYMGSSVVSGLGKGIVIHTGRATSFGAMSEKLLIGQSQTLFERQTHDFTVVMIRVIAVIVAAIFGIYAYYGRPFAESLLFAVAIAVQITPETLPMVAALNLSRGALDMSRKKVIVKRLSAIQNFGAMDVLCSDKTGTLTQNEVVLERYVTVDGKDDDGVFHYAYLNGFYQKGIRTLLNSSIVKHENRDVSAWAFLDEVPFDFERKINSVIVKKGEPIIVALGAPEEIIKRSASYEKDGEVRHLDISEYEKLLEPYREFSKDGFRVLAVAYKTIEERGKDPGYSVKDESDLILRGFLAFLDPPKTSAKHAVDTLVSAGIAFKIVTGDSELVTQKICRDLGIHDGGVLLGSEMEHLSEEGFLDACERTSIFARVSPEQKERIIRAIRAKGHTVGYLGDGINDALSLRAADIGISVNNAVDVAKESASIVLLEKDLQALADGVFEGRKVFTNFMSYLQSVGSVNASYMLSFVGATVFLPFLPMNPLQILLNNYLFEITQTGYPSDNVDKENLRVPHSWNVAELVRRMVIFGSAIAAVNFAMFFSFLTIFGDSAKGMDIFRSAWFYETLFVETMLVFAIRTRKNPFKKSSPSKTLASLVFGTLAVSLLIPFSPLSSVFSIVPIPLLAATGVLVFAATSLILVRFAKKYAVEPYAP